MTTVQSEKSTDPSESAVTVVTSLLGRAAKLKAPNCDGRHWRCQRLGNISSAGQINPSKGNLL
jgi:hypothetical protein